MNKVRGYIFSRPFMGERVPQHVQNLVIRDYCERHQLQFLLSATEYAMPNCHLIFEQILSELSDLHGLVAYSCRKAKDAVNIFTNGYVSKTKVCTSQLKA